MSFTVTATQGGGTNAGTMLQVKVLTGATAAGGASAANYGSGVFSASVNPTSTNSLIACGLVNDAGTAAYNLAANNTLWANDIDTTNGFTGSASFYSGTVTAGTPVTVGATSPTSAAEGYAIYEVKPSGGSTPAVDGSSPAIVSANATSAQTAAFNPPGGAVLLAIVACNGTGAAPNTTITMSDTSGLGLTWTQRAATATGGGAFIFTTTLPGGGGGAAPGGLLPKPRRRGRIRQRRMSPPQFPDASAPPQAIVNAGVAVASGAAMGPVFSRFLTGTAGSGTAQYLTDQTGAPYMLRWDTVWNLIVNAGNSGGATTYQTDMAGYCSARAALGFNGFLTTPVATTAIPGAPNTNGNTWDGVAPFSSPGVLNNTFWTRVDYLLSQASANGLTVVLNVAYTYSVDTTGAPLKGWTTTQFQNYGAALAARYATQPNLIWEVGDDYGGSWVGGLNGYDTQFNALLTGLRGGGANQLISVENMSEGASRYSIDRATTYAWGVSNAQFNWVYSYDTAYTAVENAFTEAAAKSVPSLPNVKMDGWYDNQYNGGSLSESVELFARKWIWWTLSSGSCGAMYGQNELYQWPVNCLSSGLAGATPGSQYMQPSALNAAWNILASLPGWHLLVPDTSSALVTAGRGTRSNGAFGTGAGTAGPTSMYLGGNTYVTASRTPDPGTGSTLAVIYMPAANSQTITVAGSVMQSGYTATWVDPASGAQTSAGISSTYTRSAANSAGDHDWLLVLQVPSAVSVNAGVAAASGTAGAATAAETVPGGVAAGTGAVTGGAGAVRANAGVAAASGAVAPAVPAVSAPAAVAAASGAVTAAVPAVAVNAGVAVAAAGVTAATVSTSSAATVNAEVAAGSATAMAPQTAVAANAAPGAGAAVAAQPSAAESVTAGVAAGTGVALSPAGAHPVAAAGQAAVAAAAVAVSAPAGVPAGSGAAAAPVPAVQVFAGVAVAAAGVTGATVSTSTAGTATAGVAAASGSAAGPAAAVAATAGAAPGSAVAAAPSDAVTARGGVAAGSAAVAAAVPAAGAVPVAAAGSAVAAGPGTAVSAAAGVAAGNAAAPGATVSTATAGTANAAAAAASGVAAGPVAAVAASAPAAVAAATAPASVTPRTASAAVAAASAASPAPAAAATVAGGVAAGTGTAPAATVSTATAATASPVAAAGTASAQQAVPAVTARAGVAAATATAPAASVPQAPAQSAAGTGAAPGPGVAVSVFAGPAAALGGAGPGSVAHGLLVFAGAAQGTASPPAPGMRVAVLAAAASSQAAARQAGTVAIIPALFGTATVGGGAVTAVDTAGGQQHAAAASGAVTVDADIEGKP